MRRLIRFGLQPLALFGALALWWLMGQRIDAVLVALGAVQLVLFVLERLQPAKPDWSHTLPETLALLSATLALIVLSALLTEGYRAVLYPGLAALREGPMGTFGQWPVLVQVPLLYFLSDLIYYWVHRAIHRWPLLWRVSGHGVHHAFHRLHAVNFGVSHPLEVFFLALPMIFLASLFGASPEAVAGATVLFVTNTSLAHSNLDMATPGLDRLFTTSNQHRRHHSAVFEESNSNYACNAIVWDRLFSTFSEGPVEQTGIGPRQLSAWELLILPIREPSDADTVAHRLKD